MKILSASQTKEADQFTIEHEPISSLMLMERAAQRATHKLLELFPEGRFAIFCGKGNNGGDGLVISRLLAEKGFAVQTIVIEHKGEGSADFEENLKALQATDAEISHLKEGDEINGLIIPQAIIIDAILGSGLNRPLKGFIADVVKDLNQLPFPKVAVDIPTGLFADDNSENALKKVLQVDNTLTFQHPKRAFLHSKTAEIAGQVHVLDIGLKAEFYHEAKSHEYFVEEWEVSGFYRPRSKFSFKGTYGHAYLVAGQPDKAGAALLCAEAAMRSGCGLLTVNIPQEVKTALNTRLPEAMVHLRGEESELLDQAYSAIGCGPGFGTAEASAKLLKKLIQNAGQPMVLDADALNILSENKTWLPFLKPLTILTPHPGEAKRLLGVKELGWDYPQQMREFSKKYGVIVILKNAITSVFAPDGKVFYTDFASPALATAGTGDVLTGIILGLLAQGYQALHAALLGVYLHGTAGKYAGLTKAEECVLAADITLNLSSVYQKLAGKG